MSEPIRARIMSMPHAYVAEDGSLIEMELESDEKQRIMLQFYPVDLEKFVGLCSQLFSHARNQKRASVGHFEVQPVPVIAATANAPEGGGKVILSLRADNGVEYHFAVPPEETERLTAESQRAAASAKKQAKQSRH